MLIIGKKNDEAVSCVSKDAGESFTCSEMLAGYIPAGTLLFNGQMVMTIMKSAVCLYSLATAVSNAADWLVCLIVIFSSRFSLVVFQGFGFFFSAIASYELGVCCCDFEFNFGHIQLPPCPH